MVVKLYRANWSWGKDTDKILLQKFKGSSILNFPCGMSQIGDVRADIDPKVFPDVICDLNHPPFRPNSFDVVICDPEASQFGKFKWMLQLSAIAKSIFYLWTPGTVFTLKNFKIAFDVTWRPGNIFARLFVVYTRKQTTLDYSVSGPALI